MTVAVVAFLFAFLISYVLTPCVRSVSRRIGYVDQPDGQRKMQKDAVALGGGIALLIATLMASLLLFYLIGIDVLQYWFSGEQRWLPLVGLAAAAGVITIAGTIDDSQGMRGSTKLLWQCLAAALVVGSGLSFSRFRMLGAEYQLQFLGILVSAVWILASINSLNLIDGIDGLAGTVGVVFSLTIGTLALYFHYYADAIIVFALAGALLGFLRYNYSPATIYLGDTGSMLIGLILGTIALRSTTKQAFSVALSVPLAIWAIPIFDSAAAFMRRKLTGRSIFATDRGHFHHILMTRGLRNGYVVALIAGLCTITSLAAIASVIFENEWIGIATVSCVLVLLVLTRLFGHSEFILLNSRLQGFGKIFFNQSDQQSQVALQGDHEWEKFWLTIVESVDRFQLANIELNLSLPWLQEAYYANWRRSGSKKCDSSWNIEVPLKMEDKNVGRIKVKGMAADNAKANLTGFVKFIEILESQLQDSVDNKGEVCVPESSVAVSEEIPT